MAYTAWSVVYGEQPTAAKWNQLGTNDAGFKDGTNIDNDAIINRHLANNAVDSTQVDNSQQAFIIRYLNSASSLASGWQNYLVDTTAASGGGISVSGNAVTVPRAGRYVVGCVNRQGSGSATSRGLRINVYRGGVLVDTEGVGYFGTTNVMNCSGVVNCQAGDEIRFYQYQDATSTPTGFSNMASGQDRAFVNRIWVTESRV